MIARVAVNLAFKVDSSKVGFGLENVHNQDRLGKRDIKLLGIELDWKLFRRQAMEVQDGCQ